MFTKQHYKAIAKIISESSTVMEPMTLSKKAVIRKCSELFKADSPNFDEQKFIEACKES